MLIFSACTKDDVAELFESSPEERTRHLLDSVKQNLIDSDLGWYTEYSFRIGSPSEGYFLYTTPMMIFFKENNRVEIASVFDEYERKESNYNVNYTQQIDLIFDTYSVFSFLTDISKGADFRWELDSVVNNNYYFKSRALRSEGRSYLTLEKADETSHEKYETLKAEYLRNLKIQEIRSGLMKKADQWFFRNLVIEELEEGYAFDFNSAANTIQLKGKAPSSTDVITFTSEVTIDASGRLQLATPFSIGGKEIRSFQYDLESDQLQILDSDGWSGEVIYDTKPAFTSVGLANLYLKWNYSYSTAYSDAIIERLQPIVNQEIDFQTFQLYHNHKEENLNAILIYTDPAPDKANNWDGLVDIEWEKLGEDLIRLNNSAAQWQYEGATWFETLYNNNENMKYLFDNFFCNPNGLYLDYDVSSNSMYLISKENPKYYIRVQGS